MEQAQVKMEAECGPGTEYRSRIIDPIPYYTEHAGRIAADLTSGALILSFSPGYEQPGYAHAAIARLRDALDQLDIDIDEAMARQAAALTVAA